MTSEEIAEVLESGRLPGGGEQPLLQETHASWVMLSGPYAFKVKKPVAFSFLDFSTLEKRKHFIELELELNRRLAPRVYLDVWPVRRDDGGRHAIGGNSGKIVDYALQMERLESDRQMNKLLERGEVTEEHMQQLAKLLSDFHHRADRVEIPQMVADLTDKFVDLQSVMPTLTTLLGEEHTTQLRRSLDVVPDFLHHHRARLLERQANGQLVDGHGDLHSRNIFLLEEPVVFDCLEFDAHLRHLDILNELGFFCLDLDYFSEPGLAKSFMRYYLKRNPVIEQAEDWQLFHYFKLYRCNVRMKVIALGIEPDTPAEEVSRTKAVLATYAKLFEDYLSLLTN